MLEEVFFLIVEGTFDRKPIEFKKYPSEYEIVKAIKELKGTTARIEKRYKLVK